MRKLFLSLIITLGAFAAPNLWAQKYPGSVGNGGTALSDVDANRLSQYLINICGASDATSTCTLSSSREPSASSVGDVYFVAINDYWIGSRYQGSSSASNWASIYKEINEGVDYITKVPEESKYTTSSGSFYTIQTNNVNKFFFIERTSSLRRDDCAFGGWYNEWSYVKDGNGDYSTLDSCINILNDGAPFPAPHNCANTLENNHYISLHRKDFHTENGFSFTAYFYIPKYVNTGSSSTTVTEKTGETEVVYNGKTYRIYDSQNNWGSTRTKVSDAPDNLYILENGEYILFKSSSYSDKYYIEDFWGSQGQALTVYTKSEQEKTITITVPANNTPYVFFYTIKLGEIGAEIADSNLDQSSTLKKMYDREETDYVCNYNVILDWGSSFDRYATDKYQTNANYEFSDTEKMKEHFYIQRSLNMTKWETIAEKDVVGNNMKNAIDKTYTDNNLPEFDEVTTKIGYTVYYRIVSKVQKSDGTVMSTTNSNVITVNIPGTTPFKLTLKAGGISDYIPGSMVGESYTDGYNKFKNTLIAGKAEGSIELADGYNLQLYCTKLNADGSETKKSLKTVEYVEGMSLEDMINTMGSVEDIVQTLAGGAYDAQYQLVLNRGEGKTTESNIVKILNPKVSNASVSVHRSGTPDVTTCAKKELFRNEVTFTPQVSAASGAGYYIYCNGKEVLRLDDNTNNKDFTGNNGTTYTIAEDGTITVTLYAEHLPIAVGETGETSETTTSFHYAVVHFDPIVNGHSNTYGSEAKASNYSGAKDELVVTFSTTSTSQLGSHYDLVFIRPVVKWTLNKDADDLKNLIRYDIYMKMEQAKFEENGDPSSGRTGNVTGWEGDNFGKYILRTTIEKDQKSYADEIYYARRKQNSGTWVNPIADDEIRPVSYYVKAVYSDDAVVKQNVKEKNSDVFAVKASAGGIFTAIEGVAAESVSVEANDGLITVTGASGTIVVYSATGQAVATAQGDGGVTTIDASNLNGVYIVKANNMKPTKILIK